MGAGGPFSDKIPVEGEDRPLACDWPSTEGVPLQSTKYVQQHGNLYGYTLLVYLHVELSQRKCPIALVYIVIKMIHV